MKKPGQYMPWLFYSAQKKDKLRRSDRSACPLGITYVVCRHREEQLRRRAEFMDFSFGNVPKFPPDCPELRHFCAQLFARIQTSNPFCRSSFASRSRNASFGIWTAPAGC